MNSSTFSRLLLRFVLALCLTASAHAQLRVEIAGVGANQIPIAIATFAGESESPQAISEIIRADLLRSGYFKLIDTGGAVMADARSVITGEWRDRGADAVVVGRVSKTPDGRFMVNYTLIDTIKSAAISTLDLPAPQAFLRVPAHQVADDVFEKLLGVKGAFATRIAYVTQAGKEYRLQISDVDGENVITALRSSEPIISPAWSPDGLHLAYVSFETRKPVVWVHDLMRGQRRIVANFKGSNSAPNWSPDGSRLAVALSRDGLTQIYSVDVNGGNVQRLTQSRSIDTEPQFSADGQSIYFTSDRSGGPQIYRMSASGGEAQRLTFGSSYNISPRISPDGKTLAYISRREGKFQLYSLDLSNNQEMRLSDTGKDEYPSFAPNGRYIMYATSHGRHATLSVVSSDGSVKYALSTLTGDIQEPTWGPFMK